MVGGVARDMSRVLDLIPHQREQIKELTDENAKLSRDAAKQKHETERVVAEWERKLRDATSTADHQARLRFFGRPHGGRWAHSHRSRVARGGGGQRPSGPARRPTDGGSSSRDTMVGTTE